MTDEQITTPRIDFREEIARRKLGVSPEWRWCSLKAIGPDGTLIEGGVPRLLKSGKRKGRNTWRDAILQSCIVTDAEVSAERSSYEDRTGNCWECQGTKQVFHSWTSTEGASYRECRRCDGAGLRPKVATAASR